MRGARSWIEAQKVILGRPIDPTRPPSSTSRISHPRARACVRRTGPADVRPWRTPRGASAGRVAGGGAPRQAVRSDRPGRDFADFLGICHFRALALAVNVPRRVFSTSDRALHSLE